MFKKLLLIGIATLTLSNLFAQDKNTIYLEGGGAAILYSFNYERNITDKITARIGFSSLPDETVTFTLIPIMANYLIGGGNHKLAISGGVLQISASADAEEGEYDVDLGMIPTYGVGYRYHRSSGGFFFNASVGFAPIVMPGVAFGWTF